MDVGRQRCTLAGFGIRLPFQFLIALHKNGIAFATGLLTLRTKGISQASRTCVLP
jgi:hypothetical protein